MNRFVPSFLALLFFPAALDAAPAFIQANKGGSASTSSLSLAFTSNNTAGNLIIVYADISGTSGASVSTVSDARGNTYTSAVGPISNGTDYQFQVWYAKNIPGGSNTVTITYSIAVTNDVGIAEYSGLDTVSPLDVSASNTGNSATCSTGTTAASTAASELVVANCSAFNGASYGAVSGYTLETTGTGSFIALYNKIVSSTGTQTLSTTVTSGRWIGIITTWKSPTAALNAPLRRTVVMD